MKKSIKKNYIYNLIYQVVAIILPIIVTPYVSRVLGALNIGIYSYTLSISAYFILFGSIGISLYGKREIAYVQSDKEKCSKIFFELTILRLLAMLISVFVYYLVFINGNNNYNIYYKILLLELFAEAVDISWFFQGLEEFKKIVVRNLIVKLISLICIFIFVKGANDLINYFLIYVFSMLVGNISLWLYLPQHLKKVQLSSLRIFKHVKDTMILFVPQIAIQIYTVLDRTMIGYIITDKTEVGFYTQAEKIIKLLLTIITAMGTVMLPRIASKFSEGDNKSINSYISKSFNLVYLLAFPMAFGLVSISDCFVPLFFGSGYSKVVPILRMLSPLLLFIGMSNVIGMQYLLPTKKQKEYTLSVILGALVNFILNSFLIKKYGAVGASIGTIMAEFIVTLSQILFVRKYLNVNKILLSIKQYFVSSIVMFICCMLIKRFIESNILSIIIQIIIGCIIYFICLFLLKNDFLNEFIDSMKKFIKKN